VSAGRLGCAGHHGPIRMSAAPAVTVARLPRRSLPRAACAARQSQNLDPRTHDLLHIVKALPRTGRWIFFRFAQVSDPTVAGHAPKVPLRGRHVHRFHIRNMHVNWWSYGDSNPGPLACHPQAARPPVSVLAGHRPRACAPVRSGPHRLRYFLAVRASLPGQAPNERLTSQNLQKLYRGALQGDQHPIAPDECRKAPEVAPGSGHDDCLSPTAASPRSELPATPEPLGHQSSAGPRLNARIWLICR
jgi:hypothetical protein